MQGENALHAFTLDNTAHRERLPDAIMLPGDHVPLKNLDALLGTVQDSLVDFHPIADTEIGYVRAQVLLFDMP
jgi:hypothetical protein